jgi:hypothetical protein
MVHSGDVTFDMYPSNSTKDSYVGRSTGAGNEDRGYGRLSREFKNHEISIEDVNIV